VIFQ